MKLATLLVAMFAMAAGHAGARSAFPCRWNWALDYSHRVGYVTARDNADCRGRKGSLTLGVRLLRRDETTHVWRTVRRRARTFHDLNGNRDVEVATRCATAHFKAVLRWTLRAPDGIVLARNLVRTGVLAVPSPHCSFTI